MDSWRRLWAKSEPFHPLLYHCIDVGSVAMCLWDTVIGDGCRASVASAIGCKNQKDAGKWLSFWAALHDIGKASPGFQSKDAPSRQQLAAIGFSFPPSASEYHGLITASVLPGILGAAAPGRPPLAEQLASRIATAVGGHHGVFPRSDEINGVGQHDRGVGRWNDVRQDIASHIAGVFCVGDLPAISAECEPDNAFFMTLAGLVSVADWIGSTEKYFPHTCEPTVPADYAACAKDKARNALACLCWSQWTPAETPISFPAMFDKQPRPLQQAVIDLAPALNEPTLVLIEAPTGEGKTEAALYLADCWAVTLRQRGCYFALPTMATSNQMFGRVLDFLARRYPPEDVEALNLLLLHGHAALSAEFDLLRKRPGSLLVPAEIADDTKAHDGAPPNIVAAEWFTHRKRGLLAPFGVGTIDQALLAVLQTRHVFVRLFGLAHKTVIIDEVHAYDAYMSTLLERLLEWLAALGCSVVLLSATLPEAKRKALVAAYGRVAGNPADPSEDSPYPRVSWLSATQAGSRGFRASDEAGRKTIRLDWVPDDLAQLGRKLHEALTEGGCAAVVCNTVGRAQEVYMALKEFFPNTGGDEQELDLLHARYLYEEREKREKRCVERFGPPPEAGKPNRRPRRAVLVATQIIEQSLDLDFDLMVTEMAPVDLLLQRAGRLHRHRRRRPGHLQQSSLRIIQPVRGDDGVPQFGRGTEAVYDRHILLRTWLALEDKPLIIIPDDVQELVEAAYDDRSCPPGATDALRRAFLDSYKSLVEQLKDLEWQAQLNRIRSPLYEDDILEEFNRKLEEDNPELNVALQALTRLSDPTVSVVCLYGDENHSTRDAEGRNPLDLTCVPDRDLSLMLLKRSLTISHRSLVPRIIAGAAAPASWAKCALLRHHRLLFFDANGICSDFDLRLDPELGLCFRQKEKEECL